MCRCPDLSPTGDDLQGSVLLRSVGPSHYQGNALWLLPLLTSPLLKVACPGPHEGMTVEWSCD